MPIDDADISEPIGIAVSASSMCLRGYRRPYAAHVPLAGRPRCGWLVMGRVFSPASAPATQAQHARKNIRPLFSSSPFCSPSDNSIVANNPSSSSCRPCVKPQPNIGTSQHSRQLVIASSRCPAPSHPPNIFFSGHSHKRPVSILPKSSSESTLRIA